MKILDSETPGLQRFIPLCFWHKSDFMSNGEQKNVIVGWGLAGAVLAWQFYFENRSFIVYDSLANHSTRIAAGLINPVVFKRLNKSWNADRLIPYADSFYSKIENELGIRLLSRKKIFRVFASVEEENNWSSKQGDERFTHYLKTPEKEELPAAEWVDNPYGMGKVETIGNLDTNLFLDASKTFFREKGIVYHDRRFDYKDATDTKEMFFFCEGTGMVNNPFFNHLPLNQTHGETLTIKSDTFRFEHTLNRNMFLMPVSEGEFKVGATYNWELKEPVTTEKAKKELLERLGLFARFKFEITAHEAGIRPTVVDRRPLIGVHPEQHNLFVFNGLGAKGVMIAPYYASQLMNHVFLNTGLDKEVDIRRFSK